MGRRHPIKTWINYAICAAIVFFGYRYFVGDNSQKSNDPFRGSSKGHPKDIQHPPVKSKDIQHPPVKSKDKHREPIVQHDELERQKDEEDVRVKVDDGDLQKDVAHKKETSNMLKQEQEKLVEKPMEKNTVLEKNETKEEKFHKPVNPFVEEFVDWEVEEHMIKSRASFFKSLKEKEEEFEEDEDKNLLEAHDDITFVTAGSHSTYHSTLQFIYSVQYFYPRSTIAIYDIGLTSEEKDFIESLCSTILAPMFLQLWPENLYKIRHRIWRPFVLQFALIRFGHCVYVEPGRYIYRQLIKDYLEKSRVHGVVVGGKQMKHSSYYVTNPHMYTFLNTEEKKLKKTPHFEMSLIILHNTKRVHHYFMRYLMSCTMEEYCISPPGAQPKCDQYLGGTKYGHCHRYDESAMNLILNKWHDYSPREYLMNDLITMHYDGSDPTKKVKVCNDTNDNKREEV